MNEMPPEIKALLFGLAFATIIAVLLLVFGQRPELAAIVRRRLFSSDDALMSSDDLDDDATAGSEPLHEPLRQSGSAFEQPLNMVGAPAGAPEAALADADVQLPPRISLHLSRDEIIALLALQRPGPGKPYTFSQNQIVKLVGGTAADVHKRIKEVRDGAPAVYPALDDEGQQVPGKFVIAQK